MYLCELQVVENSSRERASSSERASIFLSFASQKAHHHQREFRFPTSLRLIFSLYWWKIPFLVFVSRWHLSRGLPSTPLPLPSRALSISFSMWKSFSLSRGREKRKIFLSKGLQTHGFHSRKLASSLFLFRGRRYLSLRQTNWSIPGGHPFLLLVRLPRKERKKNGASCWGCGAIFTGIFPAGLSCRVCVCVCVPMWRHKSIFGLWCFNFLELSYFLFFW